jgi:hypothetical protein
MFEITKCGAVIARVDRLQYVKQQRDGTVINCPEAEAQGICVNDTFYHLPWLPVLPGAEDVTIEEFDGAAALAAIQEALNE